MAIAQEAEQEIREAKQMAEADVDELALVVENGSKDEP